MNMIKSIVFFVIVLIAVIVTSFFVHPFALCPEQFHMLEISGIIMLGVSLFCFVLAEVTSNYSQVDKIWSIIPVVYMCYFAFASEFDSRILLMTICIILWGARLTFNFGRKGGYSWKFWTGEEDYRWAVLRANATFKGNIVRWKLFAFFFIALYQNFLLWLITIPTVMAYAGHDKGLGASDYLVAAALIGLIIIETIADQQQWDFQTEKYRRKNAGEKLDGEFLEGFISKGLFAYSRHPNYTCEQLIWVVLYLFSISATGIWINWSMIGCLLLLILFQGSADFSEGISLSKYPHYAAYIKRVPKFLFRFW
jgi:steroid 5-alpha reductase family enzyme